MQIALARKIQFMKSRVAFLCSSEDFRHRKARVGLRLIVGLRRCAHRDCFRRTFPECLRAIV
jgi:hypothetical protein